MDKELDESLLIKMYLEGDSEALGQIYDRYAPRVYSYLRARVDASLSEDILHETFIRAAESFSNYTHNGKLQSWLFTIARNQLFDTVRKMSRRMEKSLDSHFEESTGNSGKTPLEEQLNSETGQKIFEALQELTEPQREVFLLREEAGLQFKEIAEMLEMPLNTALSHMRRAVAVLQAKLSGYVQEI
ncbi:MAG: sigma-70 family RNA polymerase sigma factor [Planctomycetes bacterium]|nr:sigma-70 family RNA polymerase sigma factor [Planctomycetota bacterium]